MDEKVKNLWIDALRSGDYKQTTKSLANNGGFCCLGVLCEVAKEKGAIKDYWADAPALPYEVEVWAGLDGSECGDDPLVSIPVGFVEENVRLESLSYCNDTLNMTFDEIANVIERSL